MLTGGNCDIPATIEQVVVDAAAIRFRPMLLTAAASRRAKSVSAGIHKLVPMITFLKKAGVPTPDRDAQGA